MDEREISNNLRSAEQWYMAHRDEMEESRTSEKRKRLDSHHCADIMMNEHRYMGHPSGDLYFYTEGIWIPGGEILLRKSCEER